MYRARKSMHLKSKLPRVNGMATPPRVAGNTVQIRNIANLNTALQGATNMNVQNMLNRQNRTSSIMPPTTNAITNEATAWMKDPRNATLPWRNVVHDMQLNPLVHLESACSSTSSYTQIRNIYNQISVENVRASTGSNNKNMSGLNKEPAKMFGHRDNNKIVYKNFDKVELSGTSKGTYCKALNMSSRPFNHQMDKNLRTSFSEVLKGSMECGNWHKKHDNNSNHIISNQNNNETVQMNMNTSLASASKSVLLSTPSMLGKAGVDKDNNKYIFDTMNPSSFVSNRCSSSYTFGDFDDFEDELYISTPIRNPRDPPCDQKKPSLSSSSSPSLSLPLTITKTDEELSSMPLSTSLSSTPLSSSKSKPASMTIQTPDKDKLQPSLEERLKQQINILKTGQLSVNQLYILDLVEDLLVQHETVLNDRMKPFNGNHRCIGFLDNNMKNKQLVKCLAYTPNAMENDVKQSTSSNTMGSTMPIKQQQQPHQPLQPKQQKQKQKEIKKGKSKEIKLQEFERERDRELDGNRERERQRVLREENQEGKNVVEKKSNSDIDVVEKDEYQTESVLNSLTNLLAGSAEKNKKKRKKKSASQTTIAQSLKNGEKIKVEVELQLNQRLYEIREVRPKSCNENESPQSIYFMKEIRVVSNDLYDQLADETINSEGELNGLHQISDETTEKVDKILKASSPFEINDGRPDDMTNWMDEFTYAHIRNFLEEPKNEPRKRMKKNSISQSKKSNDSGSDNDCKKPDKLDNGKVSCMVNRTAAAVEMPKNKKKMDKKSNQRR